MMKLNRKSVAESTPAQIDRRTDEPSIGRQEDPMSATVSPPGRSPWMTDEMFMLRELARAFFEREAVPHYERWAEQHHVDREFWRKAGEAGLLCASIPGQYGGGGGTFGH